MTTRQRRSARSGRPPLLSPGRPPVAGRDERRRFWPAIAAGMASEDAAVTAGVPQASGTRWFRKAGGMPPAMFGRSAKPLSGRYLSLAEREELAILRARGAGVRETARQMGRSASTISRELLYGRGGNGLEAAMPGSEAAAAIENAGAINVAAALGPGAPPTVTRQQL
jgi:hypothetical protein